MTTSGISNSTGQEGLQTFQNLLEGLEFGMVTAVQAGVLQARPIKFLQCSANGDLWFLTTKLISFVRNLENDARVNISLSSGDGLFSISLSGRAQLVADRAKLKELLGPASIDLVSRDLEDSGLWFLRIAAETKEAWNLLQGPFTFLFGVVNITRSGECGVPTSDHLKLSVH